MKGFLLGLGFGVAAGLLFAPAPGEETRRELRARADDAIGAGRQKYGEVLEKGRRKAGEIGREVSERTYDKVTENVRPQPGQRRA